MFIFNTLMLHFFLAITSALLCFINTFSFDIQMFFFLPYIFMLVKYINACFNIVATMTVRCLCVRLSGFSCPDYNSCFEELP